jgi:hypothetical protein
MAALLPPQHPPRLRERQQLSRLLQKKFQRPSRRCRLLGLKHPHAQVPALSAQFSTVIVHGRLVLYPTRGHQLAGLTVR